MSRSEIRTVIRAIASVEPQALSVELLPEDRTHIREQFVEAFAQAFALSLEEHLVMHDAIRMSS